jgi:quercetin dioxygenase-like cupin family protein
MCSPLAPVLVGLVAIGVGSLSCAHPPSGAGGFTELRRAAIADTDDLEVVMGLIVRSDQASTMKHYHPGGELGFVLEGSATITTEGGRTEVLNAGDSFYQPPGEWHVVTTASGGAKSVVFRVVKRGQPMIVVVE